MKDYIYGPQVKPSVRLKALFARSAMILERREELESIISDIDFIEKDTEYRHQSIEIMHSPRTPNPIDIPKYVAEELFNVRVDIIEHSEHHIKAMEKICPPVAEAMKKNKATVMQSWLAQHPDIVEELVKNYGEHVRLLQVAEIVDMMTKSVEGMDESDPVNQHVHSVFMPQIIEMR